jgi:MFS family permease
VPWIAAFFGPLVLGWISDKTGGKKRSLWLAGALFIMVPAIMLAITTPSLNLCLAGFAATSFLAFGAYSLIYALPMEIFDRRDVAKVTGIMLAWGSFAGVIAPSLIGYVLQETNSFNIAYYIFSAVSFLGGCLALVLLSKERSVHRLMEAAAVPTAAKGS